MNESRIHSRGLFFHENNTNDQISIIPNVYGYLWMTRKILAFILSCSVTSSANVWALVQWTQFVPPSVDFAMNAATNVFRYLHLVVGHFYHFGPLVIHVTLSSVCPAIAPSCSLHLHINVESRPLYSTLKNMLCRLYVFHLYVI